MKIIISPAKKLNTDNPLINKKMEFNFLKETRELISILKEKSVDEVKSLMNVSNALATLNWNRFQNWGDKNTHTFHSIFMFDGAVYESMKVHQFSKSDLQFAQNKIRILSGLYGILLPLDIVSPYRLEMSTALSYSKGKNLYDFWGDKLKAFLLSDMQQDETLINLASHEYSKALKINSLSNQVATPIFKDYKNGKLKVISFFAKKARGEMCNFIIKNQINKLEDLKLFANQGYKFDYMDEYNNLLYIR